MQLQLPTDTQPVTTEVGTATRPWRAVFNWIADRLKGDPGTASITWCSGTPEGVVAAPVGSLALRTNGGASTTLYVKESGAGVNGWVAK